MQARIGILFSVAAAAGCASVPDPVQLADLDAVPVYVYEVSTIVPVDPVIVCEDTTSPGSRLPARVCRTTAAENADRSRATHDLSRATGRPTFPDPSVPVEF
jgi:hypothetical protein